MAKAGLETRKRAARAMNLVTEEKRLLGDALPKATEGLDPADRARVGRLATGALRWASRSDRLLGPHLRMKPEDAVLNLLRLAIYEIYVEKAPSHAAVDAAVSLATRSKAGLVNGVMRNLLRRAPDWEDAPVPTVPKWLRKRLVSTWGKGQVADMEVVFAGEPPIDLTMKAGDAQDWAQKLGGKMRPDGGIRLSNAGQISTLSGYDSGDWWVQDAGASLAARVLDPKMGETVLDLCAAPGGKTMQLAATGASITALDVSNKRMERVRENLDRTGLNADIVVADALVWEPPDQFDAILLDAPCSATGTLRRHPDLAYARDGSGIEDLVKLQSDMLAKAWTWLKPRGRLVYCTCSLMPEEGETQIENVQGRLEALKVVPITGDWVDPKWMTGAGTLRVRPDHWAEIGGIDGFFVAHLQKQS